jgi:small-conductance mechanosensitive channel
MKSPQDLFPLNPYKNQKYYLGMLGLGFILLALHIIGNQLSLIVTLTHQQSSTLYSLLICLSLYGITFSKEKIEDERVQTIRSRSISLSFSALVSLMLAALIPFTFFDTVNLSLPSGIIILLMISLSIYQLHFRISLYRDPSWAFQNPEAEKYISKPKMLLLIIITLATSLMIIYQMGNGYA